MIIPRLGAGPGCRRWLHPRWNRGRRRSGWCHRHLAHRHRSARPWLNAAGKAERYAKQSQTKNFCHNRTIIRAAGAANTPMSNHTREKSENEIGFKFFTSKVSLKPL